MNTASDRMLLARVTGLPARLAVVVLGSLLLWASARVQVPFWPVPMTMQTFVVLLLPAVAGRYGLAAVALYLAEGALGLPVFAGTPEKGIGLAYMAGPTGGYLAGFLAAAALVAWLAERGATRRPVALAATLTAGLLMIYLAGVAWLAGFVGVEKAVALGVVPFLPAAALKLALAFATITAAWRLRGMR